MSTIYDVGVLLAADRNDREVWADHRARLELGLVPLTTAPVAAQVSRSERQAQLRRFLRGCDVRAFEAGDAHDVGALLAKAKASDVTDGHLVVLADRTRSSVRTGDHDDIWQLSSHLGEPVVVLPVTDR